MCVFQNVNERIKFTRIILNVSLRFETTLTELAVYASKVKKIKSMSQIQKYGFRLV